MIGEKYFRNFTIFQLSSAGWKRESGRKVQEGWDPGMLTSYGLEFKKYGTHFLHKF